MNAFFLALVMAGSPAATDSRDNAGIVLGGGAKTEVAVFDADGAAPISELTQPAVRAFEIVPPKFDPATVVRPIA